MAYVSAEYQRKRLKKLKMENPEKYNEYLDKKKKWRNEAYRNDEDFREKAINRAKKRYLTIKRK